VPGTHATIQAAADDPACTELQLGAQLFLESVAFRRPLVVTGRGPASTVVRGLLRATAGGGVLLADLRIESGCDPVLQAVDGGHLEGTGIEAARDSILACPDLVLAADGFETGDMSRWAFHLPL